MTATVVVVPDIGDFSDVPVIDILVTSGESVEAEQSLLTLESDKATIDIPAPFAGVIGDIRVVPGDTVSEGSALLELVALDAPADPAASAPPSSNPGHEANTLVTSGEPAQGAQEAQIPDHVTDKGPVPVEVQADRRDAPQDLSATRSGAQAKAGLINATPAVRRYARTLGVVLEMVAGNGARGRVLRSDVEQHVRDRLSRADETSSASAAVSVASTNAGIPPIPTVDFSRFGPVDTLPLSRIKRISGPFLKRAWLNVPHVTYQDDADITALEAFRQRLKDDPAADGTRITLLPFVMKALVNALREFPTFNASLTADGQQLVMKRYFHVGVAVDTADGLVVPVVRDVDSKGIVVLAKELADVSAVARDGKLKPGDLQGGCISISSLGGIGGTGFTPLVNAPEVAILGISRSRMTPVWNGESFKPRLMVPLSLSFDHRVIDGAEAARFMRCLCGQLGDIGRMLL